MIKKILIIVVLVYTILLSQSCVTYEKISNAQIGLSQNMNIDSSLAKLNQILNQSPEINTIQCLMNEFTMRRDSKIVVTKDIITFPVSIKKGNVDVSVKGNSYTYWTENTNITYGLNEFIKINIVKITDKSHGGVDKHPGDYVIMLERDLLKSNVNSSSWMVGFYIEENNFDFFVALFHKLMPNAIIRT